MASGFIGNEVPRKGLRVRISCSPLFFLAKWTSVHKSVHGSCRRPHLFEPAPAQRAANWLADATETDGDVATAFAARLERHDHAFAILCRLGQNEAAIFPSEPLALAVVTFAG